MMSIYHKYANGMLEMRLSSTEYNLYSRIPSKKNDPRKYVSLKRFLEEQLNGTH